METDAEADGRVEEITGANERAHPERGFITAAIALAYGVISLGWFASVSASLSKTHSFHDLITLPLILFQPNLTEIG